jgi:hypothetical protein
VITAPYELQTVAQTKQQRSRIEAYRNQIILDANCVKTAVTTATWHRP